MIPDVEWDDGYPTEESLAAVKTALSSRDYIKERERGVVDYGEWLIRNLELCSRSNCSSFEFEIADDIFGKKVKRIYFSTGGWSGAEELMGLIESDIILQHKMVQWQRGGHYVFEVRHESEA